MIPTADGACLDGIFLRGAAPALLVASPLPSSGGSMANPVGNELAYAAAHSGRASLRLDYRGVGASEGAVSDDLAELAGDLRLGAEFVLESATRGRLEEPALALGAYGTGAWAALALAFADPRVDRLVLVAPPPAAEEPPPGVPGYADVGVPVLVVQPADDPTLDLGLERERVEVARGARLELVPGETRALREGLGRLYRLLPPFLGAAPRE